MPGSELWIVLARDTPIDCVGISELKQAKEGNHESICDNKCNETVKHRHFKDCWCC